MRFLFSLTLSGLLAVSTQATVLQASDPQQIEFFESRIRPVLIEHCYECHSAESDSIKGGLLVDSAPGLLKGGESGPAIVAGAPQESLLLEAMKYESYEMPPDGKLSPQILADFEQWIAMGAPDPRNDARPSHDAAKGVDVEKGREFWAFQPPEPHVIPEIPEPQLAHNWIDHFVIAQLHDAGLEQVPVAERATLLRRIAYDLTGLPPRPDDIERYLYTDEPTTIENYIDRLLQSPQYAEHWGRHWLDVARYADSNGGDFNATFHHAWRYRNYVIETFAADRPFTQFILEQIAGDLLDSTDDAQRERQLVATGFLMLGAKMLSERDKEKLRMDVVDEQISTIGSAFLGMTLGCARCHDHKFDPIPTTDYYALAGILRSTQTLDGEIQKYVSNWTRQPLPLSSEHQLALDEFQQQSARLEKEIKARKQELKAHEADSSKSQILGQGILIDDAQATLVGDWKASTYSKNFIGDGYIHDDRKDRGNKKVIFEVDIPADGEYELRLAFPGSKGRASNVPVRIVYGTGETQIQVDQTKQAPILTMLKPIGRFPFRQDAPAIVEISNTDADGYVIVDALQLVPVEDLDAPDDPQAAQAVADVAALKQTIDDLETQLKQLQKNAPPPAPLALAVREEKQPGDYFVCIRGEHRNLGDKVQRGFLTVADFEDAPTIATDQSGRLELARWIADPRNPLTARVYVNRVWSHLLGEGLVRSVDNFGQLGQRPTHPLLLDQLAVEFVEHNWSTKWLVKQILLSRTYQLSSQHDEATWQHDPENRLLWRANRKPLPAESLRDTMLLAAGELDPARGGPPVAHLGTLVTKNTADDQGVEQTSTTMRTLYQPVIRNELPALMRVFDFADPDFVSGKRSHTTVPTQALWMLNGPFIREQSRKVIQRIDERQFSTDSERTEHLYRFVMGRPPTPEEVELTREYLGADDDRQDELWVDLAHALFASSAFRMLD